MHHIDTGHHRSREECLLKKIWGINILYAQITLFLIASSDFYVITVLSCAVWNINFHVIFRVWYECVCAVCVLCEYSVSVCAVSVWVCVLCVCCVCCECVCMLCVYVVCVHSVCVLWVCVLWECLCCDCVCCVAVSVCVCYVWVLWLCVLWVSECVCVSGVVSVCVCCECVFGACAWASYCMFPSVLTWKPEQYVKYLPL